MITMEGLYLLFLSPMEALQDIHITHSYAAVKPSAETSEAVMESRAFRKSAKELMEEQAIREIDRFCYQHALFSKLLKPSSSSIT
jgi:hypothetical protein